MNKKLVMIFGVFDGLHDGHVSFLKQARELGDHLIVVVARDESVMRLKKHAPQFILSDRMEALLEMELAHHVVEGDDTEGGWEIVLKHRPKIIALGYDQNKMAEHLARAVSSFPFECDIVMLKPHRPEELHSSILKLVSDQMS